MKTTIEIENIFDEQIKPLLLQKLGVEDVYDFITDKFRVTVDWDIEVRVKDMSHSARFDGYQSYAALDFQLQPKGICQIVIQYYLDEDQGSDYVTLEFEVVVQMKGVEDIQYDVIAPQEAELDLEKKLVSITF